MKVTKEWNWLAVYNAVNPENYLPIEDGIDKAIDPSPSPEQAVVGRDLYERLSDEAKRVLTIIYNAPEETLYALFASPVYKRFSYARILQHFAHKWGKKKATKVLNELRDFARWRFQTLQKEGGAR